MVRLSIPSPSLKDKRKYCQHYLCAMPVSTTHNEGSQMQTISHRAWNALRPLIRTLKEHASCHVAKYRWYYDLDIMSSIQKYRSLFHNPPQDLNEQYTSLKRYIQETLHEDIDVSLADLAVDQFRATWGQVGPVPRWFVHYQDRRR